MLMPISRRAPSRLSPAASTSRRDQTVTRLLVCRSHRPIRAHDPIDRRPIAASLFSASMTTVRGVMSTRRRDSRHSLH